MVYVRESSPLFIGRENRFKTIYLVLICSEKDLKNPEKVCQKAVWKTDFRIAQKRKEPLGSSRLGGRPGRSTARSAGKEPLAPVDRSGRPSSKRKQSSLRAVDRGGRPENPRATAYSRSTRAVDRQTCTSVHVLALAPVDRAGRPGSLKTEK